MPTPTYTPLANITLSGNSTSVTFSSISQAYRDLVLIVNSFNTTGPNQTINMRLNGITSGYNDVFIGGDGGSGFSSTNNNQPTTRFMFAGPSYPAAMAIANIMDYSATNKDKTILLRDGQANNQVRNTTIRLGLTSAVTSIQIYGDSNPSFTAGSTFALYGVVA